jgi:protein DJ-1
MVAALVLIADGTEEMELYASARETILTAGLLIEPFSTISYDTLVRAGVKCTSAFVAPTDEAPASLVATGSRGIKFVADVALDPAAHGPVGAHHSRLGPAEETSTQENFDLLVIPGGAKGAETLSKSTHCATPDSGVHQGRQIRWNDLRWLAFTTTSSVCI